MNTEQRSGNSSPLFKIIKIIFLFPLAFCITGAGFWLLIKSTMLFNACAKEGYIAWSYIMKYAFTGLWALSLAFLVWMALLPERIKHVKASTAGWICAVFFGASVRFTMVNMEITESFRRVNYPSYIETWPTQTLTTEKDCDYNRDRIYLSGYFSFLKNDFRPNANVEVVEAPEFTDSYRVEVRFKGEESKLRIYHDDYEAEHSGIYQDGIDVWPVVYYSELPPSDVAYMYKHKEDLNYVDRVAIEKITIRTAYPEKIDVSNIKARG